MTNEMSPVSMTDKLAEFLLPTEGEIHVGHLALGEMFSMFKALIEARVADDVEAFTSIRNMLTLRNLPLVKTISRRYEYLLIPHHGPADPAIELADLLTIRESWVLKLRFGLTFEDALSLNEISKRVGLSRQRICQIEAEALKKLRTLHVWRLVSGYALELGISTPYNIIPQGWSKVQSYLDSIKNIPLGDWNIHGVMTTVTMFFGITRAILISETKDSEITTARDLTVYLLARKCVLSYEDIARVLSFRSPARCEIAMRRIKEQMKKWGREDLWEESPFESLFKSEAEIAAPMD